MRTQLSRGVEVSLAIVLELAKLPAQQADWELHMLGLGPEPTQDIDPIGDHFKVDLPH